MTTEALLVDYRNPQQAEDLIQLLNEYACDPMGGGEALPSDIKSSLVDALISRPQMFSIICYVNKQPAGLVNCIEGFSTFKCKPLINIHDFSISKAFRKRGLSRIMLEKVEEIARSRQCCKITLEVLEGNTRAQSVYQRHGFAGYSLDPAQGHALFWEKTL